MGFHFEQIKEESSIYIFFKKNCIIFQFVHSKLIHMCLCPDFNGLQALLFSFEKLFSFLIPY